jgi:hypothetical protein
MKRSEAILSLSEKLQKSQNLLDGYKNGSITLKCLCDNLATRAVDYCVNELEMLPPFVDLDKPVGDKDYFTLHVDQAAYAGLCEWEPEDEA